MDLCSGSGQPHQRRAAEHHRCRGREPHHQRLLPGHRLPHVSSGHLHCGGPHLGHTEVSLCLFVCRFFCPSVCLSARPSMSAYFSVRLSVHSFVCLFICPSVRSSVCCLPIGLFVSSITAEFFRRTYISLTING